MAAFWCVCNKYFNDGRTQSSVYPIDAEVKPESTFESTARCDIYHDYFATNKEAWAFADGVKKA